jgi:lysophospholipase L1-like esterase
MNSMLRMLASVVGTSILIFSAGCGTVRTPDPDVIYVAFGDSTTAGPSEQDYPEQLAAKLNEDEKHFANEGDSGESVADGLERLRGLLDADLFPNAEVLLYWEGGTDLIDFVADVDPFVIRSPNESDYPYSRQLDDKLDDIEATIVAAIESAQDANLRVYVATYFPLRSGADCPTAPLHLLLPAQAERANEYVELLNERIRDAADAGGAAVIDIALLGDTLLDDSNNYFDCNHLSAQGNGIVADAFKSALD